MSNKIVLHEQTLRIQYHNGMKVDKIAALHNVSTDVVKSNLKNYGIKRLNKLMQKVNKSKLKKLYCDDNLSINQISKRYKVKWETTEKALIECGLLKSRAKEIGN